MNLCLLLTIDEKRSSPFRYLYGWGSENEGKDIRNCLSYHSMACFYWYLWVTLSILSCKRLISFWRSYMCPDRTRCGGSCVRLKTLRDLSPICHLSIPVYNGLWSWIFYLQRTQNLPRDEELFSFFEYLSSWDMQTCSSLNHCGAVIVKLYEDYVALMTLMLS